MHEEQEEQDADAQHQLEGLRIVYEACCLFFLGTQAAEEAAAAAATTGDTPAAAGFPTNSLPLAAAMMLDRWSLLLHPDRPSCITPQMMARKAMLLHQGCESPSLRREIKEELLGRRMLAHEQAAALAEHGETFEVSRRPHIYDIPFPPRAPELFRQQSKPTVATTAATASTPADGGGSGMLPFSESHVYTASRAFYARNHERAWISAVPFGVTTNAKLADAYARVLLAYLRDVEEEGEEGDLSDGGGDCGVDPAEEEHEGPRTAHIVELAAGHGLFGFLLAKRLRELSASYRWRVRLVMTDFNRALLESRRDAPWLRPFVADGSVDFAVLDASASASDEPQPQPQPSQPLQQPLELLSGRVLRPGRLRGPLIVLGNYALDSLPADVFFQLPRSRRTSTSNSSSNEQEESEEEKDADGGGAASVVRELVADPTTRCFHLAAPCPARLAAYPHAGLLRAMLSRGREGLHVVNVGFLAALAQLRGLLHPANRHVAVLAGDGAFQHDDDTWLEQQPEGLPRAPLPDMSPAPGSGCFALAVDAQALALAVRWAFRSEDGGDGEEEDWVAIRNTEVESSITVSFVARLPRRRGGGSGNSGSHAFARTRAAFWRRLCLENPSDIEHIGGLLQQEAEEDAAGPSFSHPGRRSLLGCLGLRGILGLLAWSNHDADLWFCLLWVLRAHVGRLRDREGGDGSRGMRARVAVASIQCLQHRLALGAKAWHYTRLVGMRFFYALQEPAVALVFFLHDAHAGAFVPTTPPLQWDAAFDAGFARAAEAFLVVRCLEALDGKERECGKRYDFPAGVRRRILKSALENAGLRDGKGRRRIRRALERDYSVV